MSTQIDSAEQFVSHLYSTLSNPQRWESLEPRALLQLIYHGQVMYGHTHEQELIEWLVPIYEHAVEITMEPDRFACYQAVLPLVAEREATLGALLPFIVLETSKRIVSTAALDFSMIGVPGEPLNAVEQMVECLTERRTRNLGAILGGLICLGDRRVNELLKPLRDGTPADEVAVASQCQSGYPSIPAFEFWLEWLERLPGDYEDAVFGNCAAALVRLAEAAKMTPFVDVQRNFCVAPDDTPYEITATYSREEVGLLFHKRLVTIEERECEPKIFPAVLARYCVDRATSQTGCSADGLRNN